MKNAYIHQILPSCDKTWLTGVNETWWCNKALKIWSGNGLGNTFLLDSTKPLPDTILMYHEYVIQCILAHFEQYSLDIDHKIYIHKILLNKQRSTLWSPVVDTELLWRSWSFSPDWLFPWLWSDLVVNSWKPLPKYESAYPTQFIPELLEYYWYESPCTNGCNSLSILENAV